MNSIHRIQSWAAANHPVRVAVIGAGFVGKGLVHVLSRIEGIDTVLVVNRTLEHGVEAYLRAGHARSDIVVSDDTRELASAIATGRPALTKHPEVLPDLQDVDVVFEATGAIGYGAEVVLMALSAGKHVVSMNAELDATVGYLLHATARRHGVVYTISDGDQPGVILRQMRLMQGMGFDITAAVNCKRHLDRHQTPEDSQGFANRDSNSVRMSTAFGDGTKMNVEQVVIGNVTGLVPDCRGMHGVQTTLERASVDIMAAQSRSAVVEYTLGGDFGAGVGVVGYADDPVMDGQALANYKMGKGPYYFFFRPYHLVHFEAAFTIADVVLDGIGLGAPDGPPVAEVVSLAKQDLPAGFRLDGIGGAACYGEADTVERSEGMLPVGICQHATLIRPLGRDEPVRLQDVELDDSAVIVRLRREQDMLVARSAARLAAG